MLEASPWKVPTPQFAIIEKEMAFPGKSLTLSLSLSLVRALTNFSQKVLPLLKKNSNPHTLSSLPLQALRRNLYPIPSSFFFLFCTQPEGKSLAESPLWRRVWK